MKSFLFLQRLARISGLIITVFLFLFMLVDVGLSMQKENGQSQLINLVFSHLLWPAIALVMTVMSWKNHLFGTLLFALAGLGYVAMAWGRFPLSVYLVIAGPFFLTSLLHGLAWQSITDKRA